MPLKQKAISGVLWSSIGKFSGLGIEFIVGIILARLLAPKEFGTLGTIMVVISLSQVFINSGFSQALVRKQDCTQQDYSTVFFFNLIVGVALFTFLFFTAGYISQFYKNTALKPLLQVLGLGLIISALTLIQSTSLVKRIDFKLQTKIAVIASLGSGVISIAMALSGFGVWSLVAKYLVNQSVTSLLLWIWNRWKPDMVFSIAALKELFGFGSKLLISGLIGTFFTNIYYIAIGRYFSSTDLGFYTRAELFKNLPSQNISDITTSVGYTVLVRVQNDPHQLKAAFRRMIKTTFFIVSILMFGLAATANSLILTLVGTQWKPSAVYLQLLCFAGLLYPLNSINVNILNVVGRSDLYLRLQLFSQILTIPAILVGIVYGMKALILGICFNSLVSFFWFSRAAVKYSGYSLQEQLKDIFKPFCLASIMGVCVFMINYIIDFPPLIILLVQIIVGFVLVIFFSNILKVEEYYYLKSTFVDSFFKKLKH